MGLGLRHPDLLAQLPVGPALPPLTRLLRLRTRARFRDQQRPGLRTVRQRSSRPRRVPQPRHPVTHIARTPLLHRPLRAPHRFSDLRGAQPLTRRQHDPRPLDHPHLRTRRAHDPLKLPPVLVTDLHPPAHTRDGHHHPPSSPNMTRTSSRTAPTNPYLGANLQEPPLAARGARTRCLVTNHERAGRSRASAASIARARGCGRQRCARLAACRVRPRSGAHERAPAIPTSRRCMS